MATHPEDIVTVVTSNGKELKLHTGLFINNEFIKAENNKTLETINPVTEKPICKVAEASPADVDRAVDAAVKAFHNPSWGKLPVKDRSLLLLKLADLIERNIDELAAIESLDNGKPIVYAKNFDVVETALCFRYYAGWADKIHGKTINTKDDLFCYTRHEPLGVVGAIIPWNFPLLMLAWKCAPALACGNTIVLKTAEQTPLSALKLAELTREAGFPPGVLNIITGFGSITGAHLAAHERIDKVAFTGSTVTGRKIMAAASLHLKKVTLELGGKSPNIILDDADVDHAVSWANSGIFFNSGQCCTAGSRIYVHEKIYDEFLEKFNAKAQKIVIGDPFQKGITHGPQVSQLQFDRIMSYIKSGKEEGAKCVIGGERHGNEGYFIQPTVFVDVKEDMKIMKEEIFGPVVCISKFKTVEEVIEKANTSDYGLAAAVFTKNITSAIRISNDLRAGTVWVNNYNQFDYNTPFGGYKQSGFGRENGKYALDTYTQVKCVKISTAQ